MRCNNCGNESISGAAFCTNCGTPTNPYAPANPYAPPDPYAPQHPLPGGQQKSKTGIVIGVLAGAIALVALIIGGFFLAGVFGGDSEIPGLTGIWESESKEEEIILTDEERFDLLMDELFEDWITGDSLTMNYFLADPGALGIERPETSYGEVITPERIREAKEETQELNEELNSYKYESLRNDQQVVYDILARIIEVSEVLEREEDFSYYTGYIRPLNGIQVQLPILLAEFNFYTQEDIGRYLDLLEDTRRYFDDIIEFERERSKRGFFLSEANVDSVIEQIESYLEDRDDNLLITVFNDRIDEYEGLDTQQREDFKQRNRELVLGNVLPAYDTLLGAMQELRGVGARQGGLAVLPDGEKYAHTSLRLRVGTDRTVEEIRDLLEEWVDVIWMDILTALQSNPELYDGLVNDRLGQVADGTPESYISTLKSKIDGDFPSIRPTQLVILEVHESLQEHTSPAFYLAPAVDRFDDNVVYVNPADIRDNLFLFTALAHESYPGHMYQTVYFLQQSPHPVRVSLSNTGYSEGWATYAEMRSYYYTTTDEEEAALMWNFRLFDLLVQSNADFGVNVLGWSFDDVARFFASLNITDVEVVENVYDMVTGVPLNSLPYSLGYIEMLTLLSDTEKETGGSFDLLDFHRQILDFGPAPYPIIREHITKS